MRLILEKADLLKIIEDHLDEKFDPDVVKVRADPFEVELMGLPPPESQAKRQPRRSGRVEGDPEDKPHGSPAFTAPGEEEEEMPGRNLGPGATHTPPPPGSDEMDGDPAEILRKAQEIEEQLARERTPEE